MIREFHRCRICNSPHLTPVLDLGTQCLTGVFPKTREERITSGPLELVKCHAGDGCGLVQLRHSYESAEMYGDNYGYRSGLNRSMIEHLQATVAKLTALVPPKDGDLILDIGSNDGTLLSFYPRNLTSIGIDPSASKFREFYEPHIEVIADFFSAREFKSRFGAKKAKIITSLAMFYDLDEPIRFVEDVAEILDDDGVWHFEQSYLPLMLEHTAYDTVCHEHVEYYAQKQIKWMTDRCGLRIINVETNDVNGGSFAVTVAKKNSALRENAPAIAAMLKSEEDMRLDTLEPYAAFRDRVFSHREKLLSTLAGFSSRGTKVLGYGASTKGNVILQFCGLTSAQIPAIAEVNSDKFGKFTPGTLIPIIPEAQAHAMNPGCLLVMPWHFRNNLIQREAAYLRRGGKMIFPLPQIEIVGG